ncbi:MULTISPECIES: purine-cytosine permease family protein [unclassified Brevibacterium]|uniref:purine-cytosine permease family protein n=1 Tax=unclassified Brevibacterium TaxID=2614124 RepID=UPI001866E67A|nr:MULTISPECIES: cytosine permease [unclassified Brevibacterium]
MSSDRQRFQRTALHDASSTSDLPLLKKDRIWSFWDFSAANIGLAIATWAFLQGGAVAYYVGAKEAVASIVIGYGISIIFVALAPCIPAVRYGIEQFVSLRSSFGTAGGRAIMLALSALLAAAWAAVLAIMCGHAFANVSNELFGTDLAPDSLIVKLLGLLAVIISWLILMRGPKSIETVNKVVSPGLVVVTLLMLVLIFTQIGWSELVSLEPLAADFDKHMAFMLAIELNVAGGLAWWPNVGNLARLTRSSRAAYWPNMIGLFLASVIAAIVGAFSALALGSDDPTQWMIPLGGFVLGGLALIFVGFANINSIVAQGYAALVAVRGGTGNVGRRLPWPVLGGLILVPAVVLVFFPDITYNNYGRFVSWGAIVLGPLCAIQFVDFFILRRQHLDIRAMYDNRPGSPYHFTGGFNLVAFTTMAAGALVYTLLLDPIDYIPTEAFRWLTASIPSMLVSGTLYYVLTKTVTIPRGKGGFLRVKTQAAKPD